MKKERKLTSAELRRKESYNKICDEMEQLGYQKKDFTIGVVLANILAVIIMLPFVIAVGWLYYMVNPADSGEFSLTGSIIWFLIFFLLIVLHEVIHGLTWGLFAKNHLNSISFGIIWKFLTPYCTCSEPLKKWQYALGGAMPTLILGFILSIVAVIFKRFEMLMMSELMILAGGGDFFILLKMFLYRPHNKEVLYYDHPYECGFVVFEKNR